MHIDLSVLALLVHCLQTMCPLFPTPGADRGSELSLAGPCLLWNSEIVPQSLHQSSLLRVQAPSHLPCTWSLSDHMVGSRQEARVGDAELVTAICIGFQWLRVLYCLLFKKELKYTSAKPASPLEVCVDPTPHIHRVEMDTLSVNPWVAVKWGCRLLVVPHERQNKCIY